MPLMPMSDMLREALSQGYAVGYFETWDQYSFEAVLEAAEETRSPVILGFGGMMMNQEWFDGPGLRGLAHMGRAIAETAKVPVSFLLNEVNTFEQIIRGLAWGFNTVMLDTSRLPLEENIARTRGVVEAARSLRVDVEGECDPLPDASDAIGGHSGGRKTDPRDAARFVEETGVCALSIAIGNEHIQTEGKSAIDFELLGRIRDAVGVPLVIHGGTGFPDEAVPAAVELGVVKFNVGSVLKQIYLETAGEVLRSLPPRSDFQEIVGSRKQGDFLQIAKNRVKDEVKRRISVYNSAGKA